MPSDQSAGSSHGIKLTKKDIITKGYSMLTFFIMTKSTFYGSLLFQMGHTPLMLAHKAEVVQMLLHHSADVNTADEV